MIGVDDEVVEVGELEMKGAKDVQSLGSVVLWESKGVIEGDGDLAVQSGCAEEPHQISVGVWFCDDVASRLEEHEEPLIIWVVYTLFLEPFGVDTDIVAEEVPSEDVGLLFTISRDRLSS